MNEVEIKVTASAEGLRGEIKEAVDVAAAGQEIKIPVSMDVDGLVRDATGRLRDEMGRFVTEPIKIPVDIDEQAFDRASKTFAYGIPPVKIPAEADTDKLLASVQSAWGKAAGTGKITIPADVDPRTLETSVARAMSAAMAPVKIPATVDNDKLLADIRSAWGRAADSGQIKIPAHVDDSEVKAESAGIVTTLRNFFTGAADSEGTSAGASFAKQFMSGFGSLIGSTSRGSFTAGLMQFFSDTGGAGAGVAGGLLMAIVPQIEALAMAAPIAGAAMLGLASAGAVVKIGFDDVSKAIQAYDQAQDATQGKSAQLAAQQIAGANALTNAGIAVQDARQALADAHRTSNDQMIQADENLKNSQQSLADAQRNAANSMISAREQLSQAIQSEANAERNAADSMHSALESQSRAEDSLAQAQQSELRAQLSLTDARLQAQRTLEDLNNKVIDSSIAQQQAKEQLLSAQVALNQARSGQGGDPAAAQTAVLAAQQHLNEVTLDYARAQQDAATANQRGVDGAKNVVSAQDALVSAQNQVKDATQSVADADNKVTETQLTNAQQVADAKQKVTDAQRNLSDTEISTNEQIAQAQQKLSDSQRALDSTRISSAEQVTSAQEHLNEAIRAQNQAIAESKAQAESAAGSLAAYNAMLADLAPNAEEFVRWVSSMHDTWETFQRDIQQNLFQGIAADLQNLAANLLPTVEGGATKVASAINSVIHLIAQWLGQKDSVKDIGTLFDNISTTIKNIGPGLVAVLDIFLQLLTVGSGELPDMAGGFSKAAENADQFIRNARQTGQLKQWVDEGKRSLEDLVTITSNLLQIFSNLFGEGGPNARLFGGLAEVTGAIKDLTALKKPIDDFFKGMQDDTTNAGKALHDWSDQMVTSEPELKKAIWDFITNPPPKPDLSHWFDSLILARDIGKQVGQDLWNFITHPPPRPDLTGYFATLSIAVGVGKGLVGDIWHFLTTPPPAPDLSHFFDSLWNGFKGVYNAIANAWNSLKFQMPSIDLFGYHTPSFWVEVPQLPTFRAAGGPAAGLTLLGEQGPELVRLPSGSQVMPAANTQAMLSQGGTQTVHVVLEWQGQGDLFEIIRNGVRVRGGNVQKVLGH